jgi:GAF domain-containing protein
LTDNELGLVSGLSLYVGAAFQNVRLFEKLHQRAAQFQNMMEISRSLTASLDLDTVLGSIVEKAIELLHCQGGSLLLVDEESRELVFKVALGPNSEKLVGTRLPHGVGIVGAVMRDRKPLMVNDAKSDPRHYGKIDETTALTTQSLLCVPLINQDRTLGVIEVMNKKDGTHFDDEERDILSAFALQAIIALDNARLYSDLRRAFTDTVR